MREIDDETGRPQAGGANSAAALSAARSQALTALLIALRWGDERASTALARIAAHHDGFPASGC